MNHQELKQFKINLKQMFIQRSYSKCIAIGSSENVKVNETK